MDSIIHCNNIDEIIAFLKDKNIINREAPFCMNCNEMFKWRKRNNTKDVFTWLCTKCDSTCSIRRNSFLEEFKVPLLKIVKLIYAFAFEHKIQDTCLELDLSKPKIIKFYQRLKEMICFE